MAGSGTVGRSLKHRRYRKLRSGGERASSSGRYGCTSRTALEVAGSESPATSAASEASEETAADIRWNSKGNGWHDAPAASTSGGSTAGEAGTPEPMDIPRKPERAWVRCAGYVGDTTIFGWDSEGSAGEDFRWKLQKEAVVASDAATYFERFTGIIMSPEAYAKSAFVQGATHARRRRTRS